MSAICLSNSLVSHYLKYTFAESFDKKIIRNLLKYIHPFVVSKNQHTIFSDPSFIMQINNDPLLNVVDKCSDEELVSISTLKLQLVERNTNSDFTEVNIVPLIANSEKIDMAIGATYENSNGKDKAITHMKALLSNAKWIKVTDGYIDANPSQWNENKRLLEDIIPKKAIDVTIVSGSFSKKNELEAICSDWNVRVQNMGQHTHDRYIETDKLNILLSSGLYNLSTNSNKDMTYRIKIK